MKKRLLAGFLTAAMLTSLFPLPALALEEQRPEWEVTAFDPLDEGTALQTVTQGDGKPVLPDTLTAWAYRIEGGMETIVPPERLEPQAPEVQEGTKQTLSKGEQPPANGQEEPPSLGEADPAPGENGGEADPTHSEDGEDAPTAALAKNYPAPAEKQEPDIRQIAIPDVTWTAEPEYDRNTPGEYIYTPVLPAAYAVDESAEPPTITVTVTAREPEQTPVERVQPLIDALPDSEDITVENAGNVAAQIKAIDEASEALTEDERAGLDVTQYETVMLALAAMVNDTPAQLLMESGIEYLDSDGATQTCTSATVADSGAATWSDGWYVVNSEITFSERITVTGAVHLILANGCKLNAENGGINVSDGNSLTIYAQSTGDNMGQLSAKGGKDQAGIGGGKDQSGGAIIINGGSVTAKGNGSGASIGGGSKGAGGRITINGGSVTAAGGDRMGESGAGIGTVGYANDANRNSVITINGGIVKATGGYQDGAGIGGGLYGTGGTITINGGSVTADGRGGGAGIGGGYGYRSANDSFDGGVITINGGSVTAVGGSRGGAGIGGGWHGGGGAISITGGSVTASGGDGSAGGGAGIGGGANGGGGAISITGGVVTATGGHYERGNLSLYGSGIGNGADTGANPDTSGTFSSQNGNAVIIASSISDQTGKETAWSGIIFEGSEGKVYGDQTLQEDFEVPNGKTLTVPAGATLTIGSGVTLTNNGAIIVNGELNNNGAVQVKMTLDANGGSVTPASAYLTYGGTYGSLPTPTCDGYTFDGWYTAASGGEKIENTTQVTIPSAHTLYAHWNFTGSGTDSDPYRIPDLTALEMLRDRVNGGESYEGQYFKLTADIDMSAKYGEGEGKASWTPIGLPTATFKGTFDGGNHGITNLYISAKTTYSLGLFGTIDKSSTIKNVTVGGIINADGNANVGGICASVTA